MSGRRAKGWRLGGPRAPRWIQAPCAPHIKARTREDIALLRDLLLVDTLPDEHPLKQLWSTSEGGPKLAEARFHLHHIADDLREVAAVQGAGALMKAMVRDVKNFAAYRYELRIAAALARSPGQKVLALGGKDQGPDIVVSTRSGHRSGIACYRAETATETLQKAASVFGAVMRSIAEVVAAAPLPSWTMTLMITFPSYPIRKEDEAEAIELFTERWRSTDIAPATGPRGVAFAPTWGERLDAPGPIRLLLHAPITAHERRRVTGKVNEKLERESESWARDFDGPTLMCVEESDFCAGFDEEALKTIVAAEASHPFLMLVRTWPFFVEETRARRLPMERISWSARPGDRGLDVGLATFTDNYPSWTKDHLAIEMIPNTARAQWNISPSGAHIEVREVSPLTLHRRLVRHPWPDASRRPTAEELEPLIARLMPELSRM